MLVLGIETSCDETAAAIVENGSCILSNVVLSSLHLHRPYGGVVPEIASRHHAELIDLVIKQAFLKAGRKIKDIGLVAVTTQPGLIGSLLVGISAAKGLALASEIPFIGVNHVWAHLYAALMGKAKIDFPFVGLVISGGHTDLFFVRDFNKYEILGRTTDDAVGEAFDKAAKVLGLGYPGGAVIEKYARRGDPAAINFPKSLLDGESLDFSFSGIKTAVLRYVQENSTSLRHSQVVAHIYPLTLGPLPKGERERVRGDIRNANICASFQDSVIDVIVEKSIRACRKRHLRVLVVGGGVSVNQRLRYKLNEECKRFKINVYFPARGLCLDNAAMVAGLGYWLHKKRSLAAHTGTPCN